MAPAVSDLFQLNVDLAIRNLKLRLYSSFPNARKRNVTTSRCSGHMGQRNVVSCFVILDPAVISTNVWVFLMIFFSTQKKQHQNSIIIFLLLLPCNYKPKFCNHFHDSTKVYKWIFVFSNKYWLSVFFFYLYIFVINFSLNLRTYYFSFNLIGKSENLNRFTGNKTRFHPPVLLES